MDVYGLPKFADRLGLDIVEVAPERAVAQLKIRPELCNRSGFAAGGLLIDIADMLASMLTFAGLPEGARSTTIESSTNFIASVPAERTVRAECTLIHKEPGRMVWQTRITLADGRLAAAVSQTELIHPAEKTI